jgi:hypothetical protein
MSLVVKPSARERFTPRELIAAYEEPETHLVMLSHPTGWKLNSAESICRILNKTM